MFELRNGYSRSNLTFQFMGRLSVLWRRFTEFLLSGDADFPKNSARHPHRLSAKRNLTGCTDVHSFDDDDAPNVTRAGPSLIVTPSGSLLLAIIELSPSNMLS